MFFGEDEVDIDGSSYEYIWFKNGSEWIYNKEEMKGKELQDIPITELDGAEIYFTAELKTNSANE